MKKIFLVLLFISGWLISEAQTKVIWTCPMHAQIKRDKPGACPICGMDLVKKTVKISQPMAPPKKQAPPKPFENPPIKKEVKDEVVKKDTSEKVDAKMDDNNMPMDSTEGHISDQIPVKVYILPGKTIRYDLYVKDTIVKFTGKTKRAIAINGSIPAPTLTFTEGDTAEIYLHNMLTEETSLHWHGVILPNQADGVPFLTTARIGPGQTHLYKFKVV